MSNIVTLPDLRTIIEQDYDALVLFASDNGVPLATILARTTIVADRATQLDASSLDITNVSALDVLDALTQLNLNNNANLTDITTLSHNINLVNLLVANCQIQNVGTLTKMTKLGWICLPNNQISDIYSLFTDTRITDIDGQYIFPHLSPDSYKVTPTKVDRVFIPDHDDITIVADNVVSDFTVETYSISGTITYKGLPLADVTVTLSGSNSLVTNTLPDGSYTFEVGNGSYTIIPSLTDYVFVNDHEDVVVLNSDVTSIDFTSKCTILRRLSGFVLDTGDYPTSDYLDNVEITLSGDDSGVTYTDINGEWYFDKPDGNYTFTASKSGYLFIPSNTSWGEWGWGADTGGFNFYTRGEISGKITGVADVSGITITLTGGPSPIETVTGIDGTYSFEAIDYGTYTVTPSKLDHTYTPTDRVVVLSISNTNSLDTDFVSSTETNSISGTVSEYGVFKSNATVKLTDLNLDITGFNGLVQPIIKSGNYVYVGGSFTSYKGTPCFRIAKIDITTGLLDPTFNTGTGFTGGGNDTRWFVLDGNDLYVGGHFTTYNGTTRQAIAKLNATTGAVDATFDSASGCGGPSPVVSYILKSGNSLFLAGAMNTYKGINRTRLCKIDATTAALDMTFDTASGFNASTGCLQLNGNDLYVGGLFTTYKGITRQYVVKLDATTAALDGTFNTVSGFNGTVYDMLLVGSDLYCGGAFTTYKGSTRQYIAKINATTAALDATFDTVSGFDATVRQLHLIGNDLYCCGHFITYKGSARQHIAQIDATTAALDATFDAASGADNLILDFVFDGADLYMTGNFTQYKGITRQGLAKINSTTGYLDGFYSTTTLTDLNGFYEFLGLVNSTYVVRPVVVSYTYTPDHINVVILNNYAENVNFS